MTAKQTAGELVQSTVNEMMASLHIKTIRSSHDMYIYDSDEGVYLPYATESIMEKLEVMLQAQSTDFIVKEVISKIQRKTFTDIEDFDSDPNCIHVRNGILHLDTMTLEDHNRLYLSVRKLPIAYDPNADCPVFKRFLSTSLEPNDRKVVQQLFGYFLANNHKFRRAFVFVGPSHTGKTTLVNTMVAFLGRGNTRSVSLQGLCDGAYTIADLFGAMANIHDDLSAKDIKEFSFLKQLTGDSRITARKIYGHPFQFWNTAKMVFTCNAIPQAPDADDAYYGRWVIIPMEHVFTEGTNADCNMDAKLRSQEELSGILNFAIEGYRSLEEDRGFAYPSDPITEKRRYLAYSGNPIARFLVEAVVFDRNEFMDTQSIYDYYSLFCSQCNYVAADKTSFFMKFRSMVDGKVTDYRPETPGRPYSLRGMTVKLPNYPMEVTRFKYIPVSFRPSDFLDDPDD